MLLQSQLVELWKRPVQLQKQLVQLQTQLVQLQTQSSVQGQLGWAQQMR